MANFKRIPVLVDAASGKQIDEFGAVVRDNNFFRLLFDETVVLCCQFYDVSWIDGEAQLSVHPIDTDLTLEAFGDNDFDPLTSFMFLSKQTEDVDNKVNITNDWLDGSTANPVNGQLSFRIDTNTVRFGEVLQNSSGLQKFYFCITGVPSGQTEKTVLAYFRFKAENRPSSSVGTPNSADPEYLNTQEVQALVKSAPVFEFSVDGATLWHSTQAAEDRYYREQRNGGEWSEAVALVVGPQGIQGIQGEQGIQGIQGMQGETGANGTGVAPQGIYDAGTTYAINEGVTYDGSYYRGKVSSNIGNQPDASPAEWELMVSKGAGEAGGLINTILSMTAETFSYPKTGVTNPFTSASNSPNITFDVDNYGAEAAMLSTSSNEPIQFSDKPVIPTGVTNFIFKITYEPETGNAWDGSTIIWKGEAKNTTDNVAWSSITTFAIGTDTSPGSGSNPLVFEATVLLATMGLAVGDTFQMTIYVDSASTWANDVAFESCQVEVS